MSFPIDQDTFYDHLNEMLASVMHSSVIRIQGVGILLYMVSSMANLRIAIIDSDCIGDPQWRFRTIDWKGTFDQSMAYFM